MAWLNRPENTDVPADVREDAFLMLRAFRQHVLDGTLPLFDVHRGVATSLVGVCAVRSQALGSVPVSIPDIRSKEDLAAALTDHATSVRGHAP